MLRILLLCPILVACAGNTSEERVMDKSGRIVALVLRDDQRKDGAVTFYWPDGSKRCEGVYRSDRREGWWRSFHPNGTHRLLVHYTRGLKDGPRIYWDSLGRPMRAERFSLGVPEGPFIRFFPDGRLAQRSNYVNGMLEGPHAQWYTDRGGSYVNGYHHRGMPAGLWTETDSTGRLIWQAMFKNGEIVGPIRGKRRRH